MHDVIDTGRGVDGFDGRDHLILDLTARQAIQRGEVDGREPVDVTIMAAMVRRDRLRDHIGKSLLAAHQRGDLRVVPAERCLFHLVKLTLGLVPPFENSGVGGPLSIGQHRNRHVRQKPGREALGTLGWVHPVCQHSRRRGTPRGRSPETVRLESAAWVGWEYRMCDQ